jgi:uncharacterized protein (TIGR03067 family)
MLRLIIVALFLPLASQSGFAAAPNTLSDLQGTWKVASLEVDGKSVDLGGNEPRWVIKDDKISYAGKPLAVIHTDASTTPKTIDLAFLKPKRVYEGIYQVDGHRLKLCVNSQADGVKQRPVKFATRDQPALRLLVFERVNNKQESPVEGLHGFVGIMIQVDKNLGRVMIADVIAGSPARSAGLKKGDIILKVDGVEVADLGTTVRAIRQIKPGNKTTIRVKRGDKEQDIAVKADVLPFMLLD